MIACVGGDLEMVAVWGCNACCHRHAAGVRAETSNHNSELKPKGWVDNQSTTTHAYAAPSAQPSMPSSWPSTPAFPQLMASCACWLGRSSSNYRAIQVSGRQKATQLKAGNKQALAAIQC